MTATLFELAPASLTYEEWARIGHANGWLGVRSSDTVTSRSPLKGVAIRSGSQRHLLLARYNAGSMTDEEAGQQSGLAQLPRCCYWKRCSELRQAGFIRPTGETRLSTAGEAQQVCAITQAGREVLNGLA